MASCAAGYFAALSRYSSGVSYVCFADAQFIPHGAISSGVNIPSTTSEGIVHYNLTILP